MKIEKVYFERKHLRKQLPVGSAIDLIYPDIFISNLEFKFGNAIYWKLNIANIFNCKN